jgi:hypothetical protein
MASIHLPNKGTAKCKDWSLPLPKVKQRIKILYTTIMLLAQECFKNILWYNCLDQSDEYFEWMNEWNEGIFGRILKSW